MAVYHEWLCVLDGCVPWMAVCHDKLSLITISQDGATPAPHSQGVSNMFSHSKVCSNQNSMLSPQSALFGPGAHKFMEHAAAPCSGGHSSSHEHARRSFILNYHSLENA